jgi:hypothetical protein
MDSTAESPHWAEERLRYEVLRFIYNRVGANCDVLLTGPQVGVALALSAADLSRILGWLETREYLRPLDEGPELCLTAHGISVIEAPGERRRSLRG